MRGLVYRILEALGLGHESQRASLYEEGEVSLKGKLTAVVSKNDYSFLAKVDVKPLTETLLASRIRGGEAKLERWLGSSTKQIKLRCHNRRLFEYGSANLNSPLLLVVADGRLIDVEPVKLAEKCHFCRLPKFRDEFAGRALCDGLKQVDPTSRRGLVDMMPCRAETKPLIRVFSSEFSGIVSGENVGIPYSYVGREVLLDGKWINSKSVAFSSNRNAVIRTRFSYEYRAHTAKICGSCNRDLDSISISSFLIHLRRLFENHNQLIRIRGLVVA